MNLKLLNIINKSLELEANDIFLSENQMARVRIESVIRELEHEPLNKVDIAEIWSLCNCDPSKVKDWDASITVEGHRFRVNLFKHYNELGVVLRPVKTQIADMPELGLPAKILQSWIKKQNGLVFVTGATGSGKSTSLASCIEWINKNQGRHIITIEDPIEYLFKSKSSLVHQRQVGSDTKNFHTGLRSALRQSPDVIFVGEIRDKETAMTCLQAAETGHLVLSTLHSANVIDTIERITNIFGNEDRESSLLLLSSLLIGVLCQQLIPATNGGLFLAVEHMENQGAMKTWIRESNYPSIKDFINRLENPQNCSFLNYLVAAAKAGAISEKIGIESSGNEQEFSRAFRGIS